MSLNLRLSTLANFEDVKEALQTIKDFLDGSVLEKGQFQFFEIVLTAPVQNLKYSHNLKFTPKDVLQLSSIGAGVVTWNYSKFDNKFLDISSTGPCVVRAFIGQYREGSNA